jgi:hypothetical protein
MFGELFEICLEEGSRRKGLSAMLRVYQGIEKGLDPYVEDLNEALFLMFGYVKSFADYFRENPDEVDWFAKSEADYRKVQQRYLAIEKILGDALKPSSSEGDKLVALDRAVDLVHNDLPALEHFTLSQEAYDNPEIKILVSEILSLFRKLGKAQHV